MSILLLLLIQAIQSGNFAPLETYLNNFPCIELAGETCQAWQTAIANAPAPETPQQALQGAQTFDPAVTYSKGASVTVDDPPATLLCQSLTDGNLGNDPLTSAVWSCEVAPEPKLKARPIVLEGGGRRYQVGNGLLRRIPYGRLGR